MNFFNKLKSALTALSATIILSSCAGETNYESKTYHDYKDLNYMDPYDRDYYDVYNNSEPYSIIREKPHFENELFYDERFSPARDFNGHNDHFTYGRNHVHERSYR